MLSEHFKRSEFACKCGCGRDTVDVELLGCLEYVRGFFGQPVIVISGYRCRHHNEAVGGKTHSYHLTGRAADIHVHGVAPEAVFDYVRGAYPGRLGIICYDTFVHIDTRTGAPCRMPPTGTMITKTSTCRLIYNA